MVTEIEKGMVTDVVKLCEFIRSYNQEVKIVLYGHSLGTGFVFKHNQILLRAKCSNSHMFMFKFERIVSHAGKILTDKNGTSRIFKISNEMRLNK
jgi:hypothetical protein